MKMWDLGEMEKFYMALADKTRLRLLNLLRQGEVCVCFFTEVLGESQPKISRHLAYLRNSGVVHTRRDGKWIHYRIAWPEEPGARRALESALEWLSEREELRLDLEKYETVCCTPELLTQIARTPITFAGTEVGKRERVGRASRETRVKRSVHVDEPRIPGSGSEAPPNPSPSHNEIEEFLL